MMQFAVISIFPDMFSPLTQEGVVGRAFQNNIVTLHTINPRDFTVDKHRTVDDRPFGGGPGMLMRPEPLVKAVRHAKTLVGEHAKTVYLSPQGTVLKQKHFCEHAKTEEPLILIAGRYEGIDERVIDLVVDEEWSLGDFVISGGELAAMVVVDAVTRLLPGVLGHQSSALEDSFQDDLLDCPHYTRPEEFEGLKVPDVLRSGDHKAIAKWRREQQTRRTQKRRPDLLKDD